MDRLRGLSLFSGIGGVDLALKPWVRTVVYCENDRYCQAVLLSRMQSGDLDRAPIWDDVQTLTASQFNTPIDIIHGGFPCQDLSCAGRGAGLAGERSGLFFEIVRLARELGSRFIFLENVPAITIRGLERVSGELAALRYDCRWGMLSAYDMGAPHRRERWFCLAHAKSEATGSMADTMLDGRTTSEIRRCAGEGDDRGSTREDDCTIAQGRQEAAGSDRSVSEGAITDFVCGGLPTATQEPRETWAGNNAIKRTCITEKGMGDGERFIWCGNEFFPERWQSDAGILRVAHGIQKRVDRIRGLGNAVCPPTAREAFKRLMGIKEADDE